MVRLKFISTAVVALGAVLALAAQDAKSGRFANVPTESEVIQVWKDLKDTNILLVSFGFDPRYPPSGHMRATDAYRTYTYVEYIVSADFVVTQHEFDPTSVYAKHFHQLEFLLWADSDELIKMGFDLISVQRGLDETAQKLKQRGFLVRRTLGLRFRDVPVGHWASSAVHSLRDIGVLKGYPDARFRP